MAGRTARTKTRARAGRGKPAAKHGARRRRDVLLVGSLNLQDAETAMAAAAGILGPALRRVPDGETGPRSKFITWQAPLLARAPQFALQPLGPQSEWGADGRFPPRILKLRPDAAGTPEFPPLGYADAALASYATFRRLKAEGRIARSARFQVGLPTPLGVLAVFMEPDGQNLAMPSYARRMAEDIDRIGRAIPAAELAVQFDVPEEIAVFEAMHETYLADPRAEAVAQLVALMQRVPARAELGLHLCYGDISHKHWKEPDLGIMAALANAVAAKLKRRLDYVHMPVPRGWTAPADFARLRDFRLGPRTRLYLGLVHATDGVEGAKKRIAAASAHCADFGVGASCGLGRREPGDIARILSLHRAVAELG